MQLGALQDSYGELKEEDSQFPLWDFVECNPIPLLNTKQVEVENSQFPLWDFVECNISTYASLGASEIVNSQFPLLDFVECNFPLNSRLRTLRSCSLNSLCGISLNATRSLGSQPSHGEGVRLSIPFVGFRWMQHLNYNCSNDCKCQPTLNSLCGISLNATNKK